MSIHDPYKIRALFPFFSTNDLIYFDNAASTQKVGSMIEAEAEFYKNSYAPVHRGIYRLAEQATAAYEGVREQVASWLNAHKNEIVFTRGTTESINLVAQSWAQYQLQEGDEIVLTELEHHANMVPWQRLAHEKKIKLQWIPITADGNIDYSDLDQYFSSRTKLVAITHCSNALGTRIDIKKIIAVAQKYHARVLIDAAQTAAHERLNVQELGCDFLVFSAHKMAGPTGVGFLYVSRRVHQELSPWYLGGSAVFDVSYDKYTMRDMPYFLEPGTPPIAQVIACKALFDYMNNLSLPALQQHEASLCAQLIEALSTMSHIDILGPQEQLKNSGHIVSFVVPSMHAHDVAAYLDSKNIAVRAGHHCAQPIHQKLGIAASVRVSFYAYNTQEEVEALCLALQEIATL